MGLYMKKNNQLVALAGIGDDVIPCGTVIVSVSNTAPDGFLPCDGTDTTGTTNELSTHYPILYSLLGNSNVLPDYRECVLVGVGQNDTDTIADHDVYTLGEFKDDQIQNITGTVGSISTKYASDANGAFYQDTGNETYSTQGSTGTNGIVKFNASRVARTGTTTHGKQKGVAYYIKATASAPTGIDSNAWKQYVSGWVDITSDWSVTYSSTGTPTLEKVLWRPSTKELKVIVNATGISVGSNGTFSIVATYNGTNPDIVAMKGAPFEHAASIQPTNPRETYTLAFVPANIQFGTTVPEFYATVRNVLSSSQGLQHIVYHITL